MEYNIKKVIKEYGFVTDPGGEAKKNIEDLHLVIEKFTTYLFCIQQNSFLFNIY